MKLAEILALCAKEGIELSVVEGALRVTAMRNKVPDSIKDVLKANKLLLIAMLGRNSIAGDEGDNLVADPSRLQGPQVVSFAQRRIWLESTLSEKAIYNTRLAGSIRSAISVPALTQALRALVQRHAVLRTVYIDDDGEPLQQVLPAAGFDVIEHDLRHLAAEAQHQFHAALLDQEMLHPFDLAADMPFRAQLLLFAPEHHELVLTIHHIATDGWSTGILLRELDELYGAFVAGTPSPLSDNAVQYVDYAAWQRGQLSGARVEALLDYWRERLADAPTLHTLPLDFPRASQQRHAGGYHLQLIGPDLQAGIRLLCAELSITPFVMLHSLFSLLVARWSGSGDVLVGSANASRGEESAQSLVGCFLNNLVLRTEVSGETTLAEFLNAQKVRFLSDLEHQQVPFELLVEQINPERSLAYHPLVQVMFGYDFRAGGDAPSASLGLQRHELDYSVSKFDLSLHAVPVDEGIEVNWGYSADLFTPATIARMADSFQTLLQAAVADPTTPVQALPMVGEAELAELSALAEGAPLQRPAPLLPHWLRSNAQQRGAQPAVLLEDHALDHAGLDARSNQFARALVAAGVRPGDRVGVCQQRTLDMVASVLGTLKAGAVYVPLDPGYPDARLAFLLADAGIGHVLAEEWLAAQLPLSGQTVVAVEAADAQSAAAFDSPVTRESAAYMIHTSGSTGQPKGVLVEHGALADKLAALAQQYGLGEDERGLLFASMSFDASLSQLLAPLCVGGSVVLRPDGMSEPEAVLAHVRAQRVTWLHVVPAYLRQLLEVDDWSGTALRRVSCGGDVLDRGLQQAWFGAGRAGIALYNSYGPTEITITASVHEVDAAQAVVPIGRPLPGGRYWVLDGQGRVLPRGAVGELCIGGRSLARGYWNRPELSGERFVTLEPLPGRVERVYRSGDRVRWNAAGELEFVGRSDHQVKVRGHRIELGEVEAALQACPGVAAAVVKLEQDSLWAYVELTESTAGQVEAALAERLPAHLLPSGYEVVGEWPLTRSGKLDRAALVRGQGAAALRRGPSTAVEQALLEIWTALLKREDIAVTDNFFQKGGHSLLATRLASQIRRRFEVAFTLKSLFELPSIEEQAALVLAQRSADASGDARLPTIPRLQHDRPVPLSFAQNRLWLLAELENASSAYNSPTAMAIDGTLDEPALERALAALVQRHEVLRTVIRDGDGDAGPVQVVLEQGRFRLAREDVSALAPEAQQQRIAALVQHSAAQPFDLSADLLLRGCLVRCAGDRHVLVLTLHHIACDGWSMAVLARELSALYALHAAGQAHTLAALPVQYRDYAQWQRGWLQGPVLAQARDYWLQRLQGLPQVHQLPLDRPRPVQPSYRGAVHRQHLPARLRQGLEAVSQRHHATLFMTVQTAFAVLLGRFSDEHDVVLGTAIANREQPELADLVGLFANTLVLRTQLQPGQRFDELLAASRQHLIADFAHQHMPFELLVEALNPARQLSHNPLFQIMLLWQNNERAQLDLGQGLRFDDYPLERAVSKFDLTLTVQDEDDGGLALSWRYASDLFEADSVQRWARAFACLLEGIVHEPGQSVARLPLHDADAAEHLRQWQQPRASAPLAAEDSLHQRVQRQAARTPQALAVSGGGRALSYAELDARADRLAAWLQRQGVGAGSVVGVCAERHVDLVVALLGTLKAGAAYLPLDPGYPAERLQYMVSDSGAGWLVGDRACLQPWAQAGGIHCLPLDALDALDAEEGSAVPALDASAGALAYMIHTSGSTGQPKGVMIGHAAVVRFLDGAHEALGGQSDYRWLAVTPVSFDISVLELFLPLTQGGTVLLAERATAQDGVALAEMLAREQANVLQATPVTWKLLREAGWQGQPGLKLLVGGEYVPASLGQWLAGLGAGAWNCYGPTESTVWTHMQRFAEAGQCVAPVSELGGRLAHVSQVVMDQQGEPAPIGGVGELWLGGGALAEGYWQRPALTAERFVERDAGAGSQRWYRSGDRVQQLGDGRLRFLGRIDQQVKLRGHRIELGEIEHCLLGVAGIADAVVDLRHSEADPEGQLAAYVVLGEGHAAPAESQWRAQLQAHLPSYMHPSSLTVLPALPLTANGKLDRRALPAPQREGEARDDLPADAAERRLAELWAELLGLPQVGVTASFFQLGGHSLLAARMVNRLHGQGIAIELRDVFLEPTIRGLARRLQAQQVPALPMPVLQRQPQTSDAGLLEAQASFAQTRLWFLEQLQPAHGAYHINSLLRLDQALDLAAFNRALSQLVQRHPALRTRFEYRQDTLYQIVQPTLLPMVPIFDLSADAPAQQAIRLEALCDEQRQARIDLTRESPFRVSLAKAGPHCWYVFFTFHHIVSDGWSLSLFLRELEQCYGACRDGGDAQLAAPAATYLDYSRWQQDSLQGVLLDRLTRYWKERMRGAPSVHALPLDRPRPPLPSHQGGVHRTRLEAHTTAKLKTFLAAQDASLFVGLKGLFSALLARYSGERDIVIGTAMANRPHIAWEDVFGYFAGTLVMRQHLPAHQDLPALVRQARDGFLSDDEHRHLPFELLVDAVQPDRSLAANPLFQIMLVLQNTMAPSASTAPDALFQPQEQQAGGSQFDLTLAVREDQGGLVLAWRYATDLFDAARIERMAAAFNRLIEHAVADPDADVHRLPILGADEIERQLHAGNPPPRQFEHGEYLVHELVEHWARQRPNAIAVAGSTSITYAVLDALAGSLAGRLQGAGVEPGSIVGLYLVPSTELVVAMLAVLKAGGAYLPLDPAQPHERVAGLISGAGVRQMLFSSASAAPSRFLREDAELQLLDVDSTRIETGAARSVAIAQRSSPDQPAYVIHTSGSTGVPKAVVLHHRGLVNHVLSQRELFGIQTDSRVLQYAAASFDVATCEVFLALCSGARLDIAEDAIRRDPLALGRFVEERQITHMLLIPSVLAALAPERLRSVQSIVVGGESIAEAQAQSWSREHRLFNAYGPSEATICAVAEEYTGNGVAIGRPIDNMACYVLDEAGGVVPHGAPGELFLAGVGLAHGYLGQPELTRQRFIEHQFENGERRRLYRTGDRVRQRADGRLEFIGRIDEQVKIRGFRIEPGEVVAALQACAGVKSAVVHAQVLAGDGKSLVAYVVPVQKMDDQGWQQWIARLREQLSARLPVHMLPEAFVQLETIPTLTNGKVDRDALPLPRLGEHTGATVEPPLTTTERTLCDAISQVLGRQIENVAVDFFQAGGNSILAMKLIARLESGFGIVVPLQALFEARSIRLLAAGIDLGQGTRATLARPPIAPLADAITAAPLSFQQARIWFLSSIESEHSTYNASRCLAIGGALDEPALEQALAALVQRHEVLRTVIRDGAGDAGPVQVVLEQDRFRLAREDVSALAPEAQQQRIAALVQHSAAQPFDLSADLLLRGCLVRRADDRHVLVLTLHHIACDGWSMAVLARELSALYALHAAGQAHTLAALPVQYRDYAQWQRGWLQGPVLAQARDYWLQRLQGLPQVHQLPLDRPRPVQPSYRGAVHRQHLPARLRQGLEAVSQRHHATLFMTVQTAFAVLLGRFSDEHDIVLGTAIANREQPELADLVGLFANTLVLRTQLQPGQRFDELLAASRQHLIADFAHQHMPFELLVEALNPARQLSHNPLFQIMLLWQNNERAQLDLGQGLRFDDYPLERAVSKFDLTLTVQDEDDGGLALSWRYASDLFEADSVQRWARAFACLLEGIVHEPGQSVARLPLHDADAAEHLRQWQQPRASAPLAAEDSLHQRVQRQAARTPQALAVSGGGRALSYAELDARADRLAAWLQRQGVGAGSVVGVCAERHVDLVVALLGTLKAGAAYLPLDPGYPAERLQYMVSDSGAGWLVGDRACLQPWAQAGGIHCLPLDALDALDAEEGSAVPALAASAGALAYMIHTSGSTGQPKGVMIGHAAVVRFLDGAHEALGGQSDYRWLAVTPVSFDISVLELFLPLTQGGTVLLAERATAQDGVALAEMLAREQANVLQATPVTWKLLREAGWQGQPGLKLLVGGEYVPASLGQWLAGLGAGAWNCYGPTESTVWTHMQRFAEAGQCVAPVSELGGRLAHVSQVVMDQQGEPAPIGGVGELWLGGGALAEGYWQRPALTAERFVERDAGAGSQRWYRSGDRVQQLGDGRLRFLGRIDQQVKLRGHRIELGEIEHCLLGVAGIADAVVDLRHSEADPEGQLAAYVVLGEGHAAPAESQWRAQLQAHLPSYMHPSSLTVLPALPLTANGKLDRRALPAPQREGEARDDLPADAAERRLAELWAELLGLPQVGVTASFFQLGGHSLLAARMAARVAAEWGVQLPVRVVFDHPSVRQLGEWLQVARLLVDAGDDATTPASDEVVI